jgi:hypothetical protein
LKKAGIILLITIVLMANFQQLLLLSIYQLNKKYFTENFCENIDAPEKNCQGQCYINKTIAKSEENQEKNFNFKWKEVEIFLSQSSFKIEFKVENKYKQDKIFSFADNPLSGIQFKILHPPQV